MANKQHYKILKSGVNKWNQWREKHPEVNPNLEMADLQNEDLRGANLSGANLRRADLRRANLSATGNYFDDLKLDGADLQDANLSEAFLSHVYFLEAKLGGADFTKACLRDASFWEADFTPALIDYKNPTELSIPRYANFSYANLINARLGKANLSNCKMVGAKLEGASLIHTTLVSANLDGVDLRGADLREANISRAWLRGADLRGAHLTWTNLSFTNFTEADLRNADISGSSLVETNLEGANLSNCRVYGVSAWDLKLEGANQDDLVITPKQPDITVDNIDVAQFIYLILNNHRIRDVIDTMTSKVVLILGRFTPDRKAVLNAIRNELRSRNYLPILFDFEKPAGLDLTETITLLARMAKFIIADLTEPSSIPQELQAIVPDVAVPVKPLLQGDRPYSMFKDYRKYHWVLSPIRYENLDGLLTVMQESVIEPAEAKVTELRRYKNELP